MPLIETKGALSAQGFGEFAQSAAPNYIEDVFSTWLYTGNGSTQTINNGIDLAGKGGMFWGKNRGDALRHWLIDSSRAGRVLYSNLTDAEGSGFGSTSPFTSTGLAFTSTNAIYNGSANTYVGWTFRKQPKFFDVVTYTGNGTSQTINHNLGSVPGCIIVKNLEGQNNWRVYHRSLGATKNLQLNLTDAENTNSGVWNDTAPTSTQFTVGSNGNVNRSGEQHVAYLFAHDAGGFGLTGTDNVISCGSVNVTSGGQYFDVNLGYEPQWLLIKGTATSNWEVYDSMRGLTNNDVSTAISNVLRPNTSGAESNTSSIQITSTGFRYYGNSYNSWGTMIYIAIRRGPMKTPTSGTSVFEPQLTTTPPTTGNTYTSSLYTNDFLLQRHRTNAVNWSATPRLTNRILMTSAANAEQTTQYNNFGQSQSGVNWVANWSNDAGNYINYFFRRAPGFFDVVTYTGDGSTALYASNLGVIPELCIVKARSATSDWFVGLLSGPSGSVYTQQYYSTLRLNTAAALGTVTQQYLFVGQGSAFGVPNAAIAAGTTYVAYLFASCAGVSKVGSYTGTGSTLQINCDFTGGARFVLIKRTDSTGDWYVWDSARGIVAGNDPYLLLNSTAAEVTSTDYVDTYSAGFEISSTAPAAINANGGSFVFLAIA